MSFLSFETKSTNLLSVDSSSLFDSNKEEISVDFKKAFNEGWQRECLMREGRVSKVHYLSPRISGIENVSKA